MLIAATLETRGGAVLFAWWDNQQVNSPNASALAERILLALPQTQCARCGYPDCAAYAQAIAAGHAAINQCPPGGAEGVERLSRITGLPAAPLNPANGTESPRAVAFIDEAWCIGCTLCMKACPTDAIFGGHKLMHTVIEHFCTGCELCVPVCPVDCIQLENVSGPSTGWSAWSQPQADQARSRYQAQRQRVGRKADKPLEQPEPLELSQGDLQHHALAQPTAPPEAPKESAAGTAQAERKRAVIEAALARARVQRGAKTSPS